MSTLPGMAAKRASAESTGYSLLAGFEVTAIGRFGVVPEALGKLEVQVDE